MSNFVKYRATSDVDSEGPDKAAANRAALASSTSYSPINETPRANPSTKGMLKRLYKAQRLLNICYVRVELKLIPYVTIASTLRQAFSYVNSKELKSLVSEARSVATNGDRKQRARVRAIERASKKGLSGKDRSEYLAKYKFCYRNELRMALHYAISALFVESLKWKGHYFEAQSQSAQNVNQGLTDEHNIDNELDPAILHSASIMVRTHTPIRLDDPLVKTKEDTFVRLESNFYLLQTRVVGLLPSKVPDKITFESLKAISRQIPELRDLTMFPFRFMHPESKRIWFAVFDLPIKPDVIFFADNEAQATSVNELVNSELAYCQDKPRLIHLLLSAGFDTDESSLMAESLMFLNSRDRMGYISRSIQGKAIRLKAGSLKDRRLRFVQEHQELYEAIQDSKNFIDEMSALRKEMAESFKELTINHEDEFLSVGKYSRLTSHFKLMLRNTMGIRDPKTRESVKRSLVRDRISCRVIYRIYTEAGQEAKEARIRLKALEKVLESHKNSTINTIDGLMIPPEFDKERAGEKLSPEDRAVIKAHNQFPT